MMSEEESQLWVVVVVDQEQRDRMYLLSMAYLRCRTFFISPEHLDVGYAFYCYLVFEDVAAAMIDCLLLSVIVCTSHSFIFLLLFCFGEFGREGKRLGA